VILWPFHSAITGRCNHVSLRQLAVPFDLSNCHCWFVSEHFHGHSEGWIRFDVQFWNTFPLSPENKHCVICVFAVKLFTIVSTAKFPTIVKKKRATHLHITIITSDLTRKSTVLLQKVIIRSHYQEICRISWNRKIYYRIDRKASPATILSQMNAIHTPITQFPLSFRLRRQNSVRTAHRPRARYKPCPSHRPWYNHTNNIWFSTSYEDCH
jgi:hypothetical protein